MPSRRPIVAIRISWPRTHSPSRVSTSFQTSRAPRPAVGRQEGQHVALEAGVLDQPEEDDRQQRRDGDRGLGDGHADLDDLVRARVRRAWRSPGDGVDERRDRPRQGGRPEVVGPRPRRSKNGGRPATCPGPGRCAAGTTMNASPTTVTKNAP